MLRRWGVPAASRCGTRRRITLRWGPDSSSARSCGGPLASTVPSPSTTSSRAGPPHSGCQVAPWRTSMQSGKSPAGARAAAVGSMRTRSRAVALLTAATGAARGAHWEIHGVDAAAIDPLRCLAGRYREPAAAITFHPRTAMTDTPFAAGCFDLVAAQFAVEYGNPPRVLDEVRRVLRPGGRAAFILHLQESEVVAGAAVELAQLRESQGLFEQAGTVLETSAAAAPARVQLAAWNGFGT